LLTATVSGSWMAASCISELTLSIRSRVRITRRRRRPYTSNLAMQRSIHQVGGKPEQSAAMNLPPQPIARPTASRMAKPHRALFLFLCSPTNGVLPRRVKTPRTGDLFLPRITVCSRQVFEHPVNALRFLSIGTADETGKPAELPYLEIGL
jgi:hypothetical protein